MVVRLPRLAEDELRRGAFARGVARIGDLYYGGVNRMPWFDVDEVRYSEEGLSGDLLELMRAIQDNRSYYSGLPIARDLAGALRLLKFSNRLEARNELIVLRSRELLRRKPGPLACPSAISWLGIDPFCLGDWSLLA